MIISENFKTQILNGKLITKDDAMSLVVQDIEKLCYDANEIRKFFCGNKFDVCTIINAKSGKCSENCKFCAQSSFYNTDSENYSFLKEKDIIEHAQYNHSRGILRYSLVTSGRMLSKNDLDKSCRVVKRIQKDIGISVCVSHGLLNQEEFRQLKKSGVSRIHNNLETSRNYFPKVCSTHTYDEKIQAIKAAQSVGLEVCSGGIIGLGETIEDRIDMAFEIRNLGIKSVPINILNPIKGTPLENNKVLTEEDILRTIAIFRFIMPDSYVRLAGGRGLIKDKGKRCFQSGANAAISGDMLTTSGINIDFDMDMIKELGFNAEL